MGEVVSVVVTFRSKEPTVTSTQTTIGEDSFEVNTLFWNAMEISGGKGKKNRYVIFNTLLFSLSFLLLLLLSHPHHVLSPLLALPFPLSVIPSSFSSFPPLPSPPPPPPPARSLNHYSLSPLSCISILSGTLVIDS